MDKIAIVVISGATREFDKQYHYKVPEEMEADLLPGMRVIVPFGKGDKPKEGYIFGFADDTKYKELKSIKRTLDAKPVLTQGLIKLACWMKQRYFCTYGAAVKCMLPAGIDVKSLTVVQLLIDGGRSQQAGCHQGVAPMGERSQEVLVHEGLTPSQKAIVSTLGENDGQLEEGELKALCGVKSRFGWHLKTLEEKGILCIKEQYSMAVRQKKIRVATLVMDPDQVREDIDNGVIKRIQQIRVLEILLDNEYVAVADLMRFASVSSSVADTLCKYGYIAYRELEVKRDPFRHKEVEPTKPMEPTREQREAIEQALTRLNERSFSEMLLHGVTGSGKTEVYMQLIEHVLDQGRQAIVLVPEISLTPQMVGRFRGRFGDLVAVQHSRLSLGERYDQWRLIRNGEVRVVVGARSAIFAPIEELGIVIIDEEHENTYKSETTPKYSASQVAVRRCMHDGALLIYGSATPSVETYQRALDGEIALVVMKERTNAMDMPATHVVDMRKELEMGNRTMFSSALSAEIKRNIAEGRQTILFLNKRGYASFVLCRSCGIRLKCRHCNITMTYHANDDRLICHYCGYTVKMPSACPKCGSGSIRQFGTGTQKVEEDLKKYFPGCSVIRMDMDTTTGKNSHEDILDAFRENNINILVGTQMIAKGHDFPNVTLVGVLAADSMLGIDDYRASERTFQLLTQVAGRAGRGIFPGRVIIQAYSTDDYSILASCNHDYESFFKQEVQVRRTLKYPPFTNIGCLVISSISDKLAFSKAKAVADFLARFIKVDAGDELLPGPARAPITRLRNRYRWRIIIKCSSIQRLTKMLAAASDEFNKMKGDASVKGLGRERSQNFNGSGGRISVDLNMDINPVSML
ncbi:MAG: primosomal protein N' [Clostridiaceae bacterium]|nr:primosomal protein N' [Clostridiaceae bacterium]